MIIYIVAGERNCRPGAVSDNGGLWANVGQTERNPQVRLLDDDYRKKAAGGKWLVLAEFDVGDSLTDHDVHKYLKSHAEVKWDYTSNTEEFLFTTDDGTGREAERIVRGFVEVNCIPMLQDKLFELQQVIEELQAGKTEAENKLKHYMETDDGKLKAECFSLLEKANEEYSLKLAELDKTNQGYLLKIAELDAEKKNTKRILKLRQSQLDQKEQQVTQQAANYRENLKERESLVLQAETQLREREWFLKSEHNKRETKINWGILATSVLVTFMIAKCSSEDAGQYKKQLKSQGASYEIQLSKKNNDILQLSEKLRAEEKELESLKNPKAVEAQGDTDNDNDPLRFNVDDCKSACMKEFSTCMKSSYRNGSFDSDAAAKCETNKGWFSDYNSKGCLNQCFKQNSLKDKYKEALKSQDK